MKKWIFLFVALLGIPALPAPLLTVDDVVSRAIQARGGEAALKALRSYRLAGTATFGSGNSSTSLAWAEVWARPGKMRDELTLQGLTNVDAFDGVDAWSVSPFEGRREPQRASADETKDHLQDADFDGPLVDWRKKGHQVEYLGREDVDGTLAHKLRVRLKNGDTLYLFLDPEYFLEIRETAYRQHRGSERVTETDFGNYERLNGVWFPHTSASGRVGELKNARYAVARVEANGAVDDTLFRYPRPGERVLAAIAPPPATSSPQELVVPRIVANSPPSSSCAVISGMNARNIGSSAMSGRISAIAATTRAGVTTVYVGAASGGVWRSTDDATTFKPIFDKQSVQSIGAITIDPSNPRRIWVGTGESWTRNSVSIGDGIYLSEDGGDTWKNMGLGDSERISRILVSPTDGKTVYACVPGKLWSDSAARGVYKTNDGGRTWRLALTGKNLSTGCGGLSMDPKDPDVLYAGLWDFRRRGWTFRSGGENAGAPSGSAFWRTSDGGKGWTELAPGKTPGIPAKPWGRVEVSIAPSDPKTLYALIESKDSALYQSNDGGKSWERRDNSQSVVWRPFYFARLVVDPTNPNRVFKPDLDLVVSDDGGKSFASSGGRAHGDWHDLWIDPTNSKHIIGGDDGGLWLSWDGGSRWWKAYNLPISQFYHVSVDAQDPYQVYGGLQDNSSWVGDSAYPGGISNARWENLYGGDGFWTAVDPTDSHAVYAESQGGELGRVDRLTHAQRSIQPLARYHEKLRFNWNTPVVTSPTDPKTLYLGAQFLFRSRDHGESWERVSPDLTTNDPKKQKQEQSGGVTVDNSSAEMHTTVYAISESPLDSRTVWVGTDDGNLQLTRDSGKSWTNVVGNVKGLPKFSWVSWVEASRFDAAVAYAAFDRHTFGDMEPWVYRTADFGKSWSRIAGPGQHVRGYAHVVKEDVVNRELLFLGTELGLWISLDLGRSWAEFKGSGFPSVAVRDLQIHPRDQDLILATHGRGIWIVDDLTPLRALSSSLLSKAVAFLPSRNIQQRMPASGGWPEGDAAYKGQNPAGDAVLTYYQKSRHLFGPLTLEVLDASGKVLDRLTPSAQAGLNRVTWTMRASPPLVPRGAAVAFSASRGPRLPPGRYVARLTRGSETVQMPFEVRVDIRAPYNAAARTENFDAAMRVHALFGEMSVLAGKIEAVRVQTGDRLARAASAGAAPEPALHAFVGTLEGLRKKIVATTEGGAITGEERIREHTQVLYSALLTWEGRPARYQLERLEVLRHELEDVNEDFDKVLAQQLPPLNEKLQRMKLPAITVPAGPVQAALLDRAKSRFVASCLESRWTGCVEGPEVSAAAAAVERD